MAAAYLAIFTNLLLLGSKDEIKIVENGTVSPLVQNDVTEAFPPILPQYTEIQLRIASEKRVSNAFIVKLLILFKKRF